jgi:hypothetical protein
MKCQAKLTNSPSPKEIINKKKEKRKRQTVTAEQARDPSTR